MFGNLRKRVASGDYTIKAEYPKMQRKETIGEVFDLLVEAQRMAPLTDDPALRAHISYLMDAATLMLGKYTHQSPMTAADKTGDDDLAFYEE